MTDSQPRQSGMRHMLYTVWIYWADDDAIEMHGAVDQHLRDANPGYYQEMVAEARAKVGGENVREVRVEVDWMEIVAAFEGSVIDGSVKS